MKQLNKYIVKELGVDSINILSEEDRNLIGNYRLGNVPFLPEKYTLNTLFYDLNGNFIETVRDVKSYKILGAVQNEEATTITVDPVKDVLDQGYLGDVQISYEVFNNLFSPSLDQDENSYLFIADISTDRTEIRAKSTTISDNRLRYYETQIYNKLNNQNYFSEIYLDFIDEGIKIVGVNIITEVIDRELYVTFKLYEPLPTNLQEKSRFTVVERIGEPVRFEVIREVEILEPEKDRLRGPNFNIDTAKVVSSTTDYINYAELLSYPAKNSKFERYSLIEESSAQISVDYTDFSNFIHFSSAVERLENFRYKLGLIRDCELSESYLRSSNRNDPNIKKYEKIRIGIISNFDHYDRYLYFESSSCAWPKSNDKKPYVNIDPNQTMPIGYTSGSIQKWWDDIYDRAVAYDNQNVDILVRSIPEAIAENPDNEAYIMFVHMIGQHFDNEWIYAKALSDRYNTDNRLDFGISKDLVRDAIESFGLTLYETNQNLTGLFELSNNGYYSTGSERVHTLKRITTGHIIEIPQQIFDGEYSLWESEDPLKNIDGEYAPRIGSEPDRVIDNGDVYTSWISSTESQPITLENYRKEVYKRIYHNIPFLIKTKGTVRGLRALINCFGIPDDILEIRIQGGTSSSLGPLVEVTSSLDKIRLDNTGSWAPLLIESGTVVSSSILSEKVSQYSKRTSPYFDDTTGVEVGFSLNKQEDQVFAQRVPFDNVYGDVVGNPKNAKENYGRAFKDLREGILKDIIEESGSLPFRTPASIIRLVRYFDSMLFRSLKDFLPARASVASGVIVEDSILNRNRYGGTSVSGSGDLTESGSIQIGSIEGSDGGSLDLRKTGRDQIFTVGVKGDKTVTVKQPSVDYFDHWTTAEATGSKAIFDDSPRFNGELSGSEYTVTDGEVFRHNPYQGKLVDGNPYLHAGSATISYTISFKFLTLPAPAGCTLNTVGSFVGVRYKVYIPQGNPVYYCSYGTIYDDCKKQASSNIILDDQKPASSADLIVDAGRVLPEITGSQYNVTTGEGSAVLLANAMYVTVLAETGSGAKFLGWYRGKITDKESRLDQYIGTTNAITIVTGSLIEEYTARYSTDNSVVLGFTGMDIREYSEPGKILVRVSIHNLPEGLGAKVRIRTNKNRLYSVTIPPFSTTGGTIISRVYDPTETIEQCGIESITSGSVTVPASWNMKYFYFNRELIEPVWYS